MVDPGNGWRVGAAWMVVFGLALGSARADVSTEEKVAADLANPLAPVTTVSGQFRAEFGNGPEDDENYQVRLQPSFFKPFAGRSAFLLRTIVPVPFRNWPTDDAGLGDITLVPYYVPDIQQRTFLGYGAALGVPTATDDALGSGKWTAGPAMIVARTGNPITVGGLVQHIESYAGESDRDDVSVTTLQPFATYLVGGGWAATLTAEAGYNWEADADEWTVPLAASLSKVVTIGGRYFNVAVGVVEYVEKPEFAPDRELRASVTYVFR